LIWRERGEAFLEVTCDKPLRPTNRS
jgi:hypothetical protein